MAVDGAQPAADQDEGALGETGICLSAVLFLFCLIKGFQPGRCSHEYAAGIQFASPGPTSRPSFLLKARPPASVTKFAAYLQVSAKMPPSAVVIQEPTCVRLAKMTSVVIKALLDFCSVVVGSTSKTRGDGRRLADTWLTR